MHNSGTGSPKINGSNNTLWETINTSTDKTGITVNQHTGSSGYNGSSTDQESRPDNFTKRIWKRVN